jgi:hypothetical protein
VPVRTSMYNLNDSCTCLYTHVPPCTVQLQLCTFLYRHVPPCTKWHHAVQDGTYWYVPVCTVSYLHVPPCTVHCTAMYLPVPPCTVLYHLVLCRYETVHTSMYWYVLLYELPMSVRTGMYHFEVSRTAMYRVRYVLVCTSTYRHVLPCMHFCYRPGFLRFIVPAIFWFL